MRPGTTLLGERDLLSYYEAWLILIDSFHSAVGASKSGGVCVRTSCPSTTPAYLASGVCVKACPVGPFYLKAVNKREQSNLISLCNADQEVRTVNVCTPCSDVSATTCPGNVPSVW